MAIRCGFFSDDTLYHQPDFAAFLKDSLNDGYVLDFEQELEVIPTVPASMAIEVSIGRCWVQGYFGWVQDSSYNIVISDNDSGNPRIDRIIARLSVTTNRVITFEVLEGTPAASPVAPTLTRTTETYEISLAQVYVADSATSITATEITDERGDPNVCGIAGVKHDWRFAANTLKLEVDSADVSGNAVDREPIYFDGTVWALSENGQYIHGYYDEVNTSIVYFGYLDGFSGLTPGQLVNNALAISATEALIYCVPIVAEAGIEVFTESGSFSVPQGVTSVDVLVVGGGGSGGGSFYAGGGGGGGVVYEENISVVQNETISIIVGAGGAGASNTRASGGNSQFGDTIIAYGGGGGAAYNIVAAQNGGSGGGGSGNTYFTGGSATQPISIYGGYGEAGGTGAASCGGGGGGAETSGNNAVASTSAGAGGDGIDLSANFGTDYGDSGVFGGGGGGGCDTGLTPGAGGDGGGGAGQVGGGAAPTAGSANTGGGGGGSSADSAAGANGGSGVVIIKWGGWTP